MERRKAARAERSVRRGQGGARRVHDPRAALLGRGARVGRSLPLGDARGARHTAGGPRLPRRRRPSLIAMGEAELAVERVARTSYGRLLAYLSSETRDVAGAEDALGEALVEALTRWPADGVPERPEAWLLAAARHRLIDQARRRQVRTEHADALLRLAERAAKTEPAGELFPDRRVELLFVCAHPAIDPALHAPLMLQTVLGLDAARIARAFLVAPAAMGQRLVRAKRKIREAGIPFRVPAAHELAPRLLAVLEAIYGAYGIGRDEPARADAPALGEDLAEEAIWLARVVRERMPDEPEVRGLLALMLFSDSRSEARSSPDGRYVPLSEQDPALWST